MVSSKYRDLSKMFKVPQKDKEGLLSSVKSLFHRKYKHIHAIKGINIQVQKGGNPRFNRAKRCGEIDNNQGVVRHPASYRGQR